MTIPRYENPFYDAAADAIDEAEIAGWEEMAEEVRKEAEAKEFFKPQPIKISAEPTLETEPGGYYYILIYKIRSLTELLLLSLDILYQENFTVRICKHCGLPFIPEKNNTKDFCPYFKDKCEKGGKKNSDKNLNQQPCKKLHDSIDRRLENRYKNLNKNKKWFALKIEFENLYDDNKKIVDEDTMLSWLQEVKNKLDNCNGQLFELPELSKDD